VRDVAGQGMEYLYLPRRSPTAPHPNVAAAVDRAASMALKSGDKEVGHPALDRAPQVELETRGAADHAGAVVDLHGAPSGGRIGATGATWRRGVQCPWQRRRPDVRAGLSVPGPEDRPEHRRVDEAVAQLGGAQRGVDRGA